MEIADTYAMQEVLRQLSLGNLRYDDTNHTYHITKRGLRLVSRCFGYWLKGSRQPDSSPDFFVLLKLDGATDEDVVNRYYKRENDRYWPRLRKAILDDLPDETKAALGIPQLRPKATVKMPEWFKTVLAEAVKDSEEFKAGNNPLLSDSWGKERVA